jgi:hypothetical protein
MKGFLVVEVALLDSVICNLPVGTPQVERSGYLPDMMTV